MTWSFISISPITDTHQGDVQVLISEPFIIPPNETLKCRVSFKIRTKGSFQGSLAIACAAESIFAVCSCIFAIMLGFGVFSNVSPNSRQIMAEEHLEIVSFV